MTEEDCKRVTGWLGPEYVTGYMGKIGRFTTPDDYFACFDRLVELGEWDEFYTYFWELWESGINRMVDYHDVFEWLNSKTPTGYMRLCWLVAEWRKGGGSIDASTRR